MDREGKGKIREGKGAIIQKYFRINNNFQRVQPTLAAFNPLTMIEYVEHWKMTNVKNLSRKYKWVKYLSSDDGEQLFNCIKGTNKMWVDYSVDKVASKIIEIYSTTSNVHHSTAHGIVMALVKLAGRIQEFNISVCT